MRGAEVVADFVRCDQHGAGAADLVAAMLSEAPNEALQIELVNAMPTV
jgi:hypothetical protein